MSLAQYSPVQFCDLRLYDDWAGVRDEARDVARAADAALVGSLVADGSAIVDWLATRDRPLFFYDIDTPVTLVSLNHAGQTEYLRADQVPLFETYFSFAGGPALTELEQRWHARRAEALAASSGVRRWASAS